MDCKNTNVALLSIDNVNSFYVIFEEQIKREAEFREHLQRDGAIATKASKIVIGEIYFVLCLADGEWYRARVESSKESRRFKVFYVDNGKSEIVDEKNLKVCPAGWQLMTPLAIHCSLDFPMNDQNEECKFFLSFVAGNREIFDLVVKKITENRSLIVDLITKNRVRNFSVSEFLLSIRGKPIDRSISLNDDTIREIEIPNFSEVKIRHVESTTEIYASLTSLEADELVMQMELKESYRNTRAYFTLIIPGAFCAVEDSQNGWHRAKVLKSADAKGSCDVRFIDIGSNFLVKWHQIYELDRRFYNCPAFSKKLEHPLAGVVPAGSDWMTKSVDFLRRTLMLPKQKVDVEYSPEGVTLYTHFSNTKINVNQSLLQLMHESAGKPNTQLPYILEDAPIISKSEVIHRVKIVDEINFDSMTFHVKLLEQDSAVKCITTLLQQRGATLETQKEWRIDDLCVSDQNESKTYVKGVVTGLSGFDILVMFDNGQEVWLKAKDLRKCPKEFAVLPPSVVKVKLACSVARRFKNQDEEEIKNFFQSFEGFYIKFKDDISNNKKPREVVLFGHTQNGNRISIVDGLEQKGFVVSTLTKEKAKKLELEQMHRMFESFCRASREPTGEIVAVGSFTVKLLRHTIDQWLPPVVITGNDFDAIGTNVDSRGNFFLFERSHEPELIDMNNLIKKYFDDPPNTPEEFKAGDTCLAPFILDGRYYRGKVIEVSGSKCSVEFIDYGNILRDVCVKSLHKNVLCSEIPPFINKFRLEGSPNDKNGEIDQVLLDKLQAFIVEQKIFVEVLKQPIIEGSPKLCWLTKGGTRLKKYVDVDSLFEIESKPKTSCQCPKSTVGLLPI